MSELSTGDLARIACILEATARKPGNVHRYADFPDLGYLDFLLASVAIAAPMDHATTAGVGATVLAAVEKTRRLTPTNVNLGIALLLAPMAAVPRSVDLVQGLPRVLDSLTVDDARWVYQAIRTASPGGLGKVKEQDVTEEPTIGLREAMDLASDRDLIARQYSNGYEQVLKEGLPSLRDRLKSGNQLEIAIVGMSLELLAHHPDSLIARKTTLATSEEASRRAQAVLDAGWPDAEEAPLAMQELDNWLRADGHRRNPGTTADLTAAVLFAALRDGTISLPRVPGSSAWCGNAIF